MHLMIFDRNCQYLVKFSQYLVLGRKKDNIIQIHEQDSPNINRPITRAGPACLFALHFHFKPMWRPSDRASICPSWTDSVGCRGASYQVLGTSCAHPQLQSTPKRLLQNDNWLGSSRLAARLDPGLSDAYPAKVEVAFNKAFNKAI